LLEDVFNADKSIHFFGRDLSHVPHLTDAETILFVEAVKVSWQYLNQNTERVPTPKLHGAYELGLRLINEMESSPGKAIKNLADKLAVDRKLLGRRLQDLLGDDDGVIRVASIARPSFFGPSVQRYLCLSKFGLARSFLWRIVSLPKAESTISV